jgi:hypothetical protein
MTQNACKWILSGAGNPQPESHKLTPRERDWVVLESETKLKRKLPEVDEKWQP